jgi:hypothetical protein
MVDFVSPKSIFQKSQTKFLIPYSPENKHPFLHITPANVLIILVKIVIMRARGAYFRDYTVKFKPTIICIIDTYNQTNLYIPAK